MVSSFIIFHIIVYYYSDDNDGNGDDAETSALTEPKGINKIGWSTSLGEAGSSFWFPNNGTATLCGLV